MSRVLSVNVARPLVVPYTDSEGGLTGIAKRPVAGPVAVAAPGPRGVAGGGLTGDAVCDLRFHGGDEQAVYAYAREDLDRWERRLGRELPDGRFGENLTTTGIDVNAALIGERWRIGAAGLVLEVTSPRIPCRTFAGWLDERGWVKRFTQEGLPGPFLRVIEPGEVRAGDPVEVVHRPDHEVTVAFLFRAMTLESELLPRVMAAADTMNRTYLEAVNNRLSPAR
ncbi:MOSC domain-containing protein [Streptomyces sp. CBMA29]|uniref:MOSC domain-containing protein n=1 Tax=Streptomyces sp. CBMA29 TaxID=1896314 RepID=UPI001661E088|nr:MOSC domain-containing protein [Streptomyces sp. CBMA29]MBD0736631.1 sulfurase [Streptomyces sp. CBMA29]